MWFQQKDYVRARTAWEKSASTGNPGGLYGLGMLYEDGLGVAKDVERALACYESAAAKNYSRANDAIARIRGVGGATEERPQAQALITEVDITKWELQAVEGFKARQGEATIRRSLLKQGCPLDYADQILEYARIKVRRQRQVEGITLVAAGAVLGYLTRVMIMSQASGKNTFLIGLLAGGLALLGVYKLLTGERGRA